MKKLFVFVCLVLVVVFLTSSSSYAWADGSVANVTITKSVLNPQTKVYVHNLGIGDAVYHPGDTVIFHITVANTGNQTVEQVIVKDYFPQYINFVSGVGSFDQKNKILSFLVYNLKSNTSQSFAVSTRVVNADQFAGNQSELCLANRATMLFGTNETSQDIAQFCITTTSSQSLSITKKVTTQPVYPPTNTKTTPSTGASPLIIPALLFLAFSGFVLMRKADTFFLKAEKFDKRHFPC